MLEGALGVVWRVNEDALHLARVVGQKRLERVEVVPLDEHVPSVSFAVRVRRDLFKQAIGRVCRGMDIVFAGEPVEQGHRFCSFLGAGLLRQHAKVVPTQVLSLRGQSSRR
jgi:hypothetical protein